MATTSNLGTAVVLFVPQTVRQMENTVLDRGTACFKLFCSSYSTYLNEHLVSFTVNALRKGSNFVGQLIVKIV